MPLCELHGDLKRRVDDHRARRVWARPVEANDVALLGRQHAERQPRRIGERAGRGGLQQDRVRNVERKARRCGVLDVAVLELDGVAVPVPAPTRQRPCTVKPRSDLLLRAVACRRIRPAGLSHDVRLK